ncbi:ribonuclease H-like domain-containing protein [Tanacetum coccineum]
MDTGASSHLNSHTSNLNTVYNKCLYPSACVGDGKSILVTNTGHSILPTLNRLLYLHNVLVTHNIIKNLIYVRQFTRDNNCTVEFDAFGFLSERFLPVISSSDVIVHEISTQSPNLLISPMLCFLSVLLRGTNASGIPGKKCCVGKHVRLPFSSSNSVVTRSFEIVHSDIWTSPVPNPRFHGHTSHISPLPKSLAVTLSDSNWYKARLVANGHSQQYGVDCDDTFSPVVKPSTIRTVLSLALSRNWPIHQLDVKNAFLNGDLSETVYMYQPPGFVDSRFPQHVCRLQRSLYGLKQAHRAWFQRFAGYALRVRFSSSRCDSSLFIYQHGSEVAYLLIYVDDIVLTASSTDLLQRIISTIHKEFDMTALGALNYFLSISVNHNSTGMFLSQKKYAMELLDQAHMASCNPTRTPIDTESKLGADEEPISDPTLYRSLAEPYFSALKRILRYVRGTLDFGLQLYASSTRAFVAYSDADWAGCLATRRSASGYCVFLGDNLLSWSAKRQHTVSRSSAEAEYRGVANVVAETAWLRNLLLELHMPLSSATLVYCDNISAIYLTVSPVQHQRTKHIKIDIHFVRDMVARGHVRVLHVPSRYQYVDIFTKGLPSALFEELRSSLLQLYMEYSGDRSGGATSPMAIVSNSHSPKSTSNNNSTSSSSQLSPSSVLTPPSPPHPVVLSPCAACKILRRRCVEKCVLAPYFPPTDPLKFTIAHRVFGASNIIKLLQELPESQRADAVSSMVYEANARVRDPVYGCAGAICQLQKQVSELQAELAKAQAEVLNMQCQHSNLLSMICMEMDQQSVSPPTLPHDTPYENLNFFPDDVNLGSLFEVEPLWT